MDFETAKENIQPLPRGRNIKALEMAINAEQSHAIQSELMQQRREYESSILSYEGDDPLELWFEYINWIEQCYPKNGKESALEEILAKCLVTFEAVEKYHQDRRMIKLYIKYIDTQQNPIDYYQELYNQGIGTRVADLYICWAHYYDANDNFEQTEAIFRKGFDAHAEPIDDLKTAHKQFGFSMSQRILYKDDLSKQEFVSKMNERRSALTSLRAHKHKFVGSLRTGVAIKNAEPGKIILKQGESKENCNTANLNVYEDEGGSTSESIPQHVSVVKSIIDSARKQENLREPGLWTKKSTKHQPMFSNEQHQDFDILEDSEEKTPIKENCKLPGIVLPENFARCNLKQSEWNVDLIIEEDSEPLKIPMYNKMYLYKKNMKKDYSIEQLRAYFWYKNNKKKNILTEEMDEHWSNNFDAGIRLPIMFFNKNIPQDTFNPNRNYEPFLQNDKKLMTLYNEIYPDNSIKEYSLEEILANRIKKGLKRINKSKNIVKNRVTQFVPVDMEETIIQHTDKKTDIYEDEETNMPDFKNNEIKFDKRVKQLSIDNGNNELKTIKKIVPDESIKDSGNIILKNKPNDDLMLPPPIPPKFFENSEKNTKSFNPNDSCSTQTFNFFIKQASISTPMKQPKAKYSLLPTESHDSIQHQQPTNQQLDYVSILPKQLSIIMETTETTTISSGSSGASTKSSVVSHITNDINTNPSVTMRDDILSTGPIKFFEDKTETVSKHFMSSNEKQNPEDDYALPFNRKVSVHHDNAVSSMCPIQIFEDKTETIPKCSIKGETIASSNRSNFVQKEDTAPSSRPIQIFEDKPIPKHHNEDDFVLPSNRKENIQYEDTFPSMCPIKIFEDKTETIPKTLIGRLFKQEKEDSIAPYNCNVIQNEDTAPSMRPIQIFEDKTETVPKLILSNNRKTIKGHLNDTDPSMCPIQIYEDTTETIPKMALGGQAKRYNEDSIAPSDHSNFVQIEDTAPSMRPIQIFEDKTETVPKHLLSNNRKTIQVHHNDTDPPMFPIEIFEHKTETIPKMALGGQTKRYKEDSITPSDRSNFVQKEDLAPSMCPIQIFEDKTEIISKQFMNTKAKQHTKNSNGKETALHDNTRLSMYADNTPVKEPEIVTNINKEEMTRNTNIHKTTDHFIDMFTKTPSKNLGAVPKVQKSNIKVNMNNDDINKKPKIFEFVKCNKTRFTDYNNSVDSMNDPLSMKGAGSHCNLKSENNSFNSEEINVSISFTDSEIYSNSKQNDKGSDDENMFDVNKEENNIMGQSIYITKSQKLLKEEELLALSHNWDENDEDDDDDGVIDNNMYMHNENTNLNITRQIIDEKLNDNPYPDPYDGNLINAFMENIDFLNYLQNLTTCALVNKLYPLKVSHSININDKIFIIQKIIGKGAYGTIFSGKCQETDELYAFKQERPANLFEYYICLELHSRLTSSQIKKAFMNIEYSLIGNNASIFISKLSPYGSLINVCNVIKEKTMHNIDEYIVMMLASQLLLALDHLHSCNIIHGDIKPDNILLMSNLIYGDYEPIFQFIDFGRGIDMQLFPKNTTFNVKLLTENFICPEMMDGRPWTYQHDLFCLASTVYVLLFGKYMTIQKKQSTWKINPNIPRYYRKSVWENFFEKLLNIPSCNQLPNLQELRDTFKEEIMLKEKYIKEKINQFNNALSKI